MATARGPADSPGRRDMTAKSVKVRARACPAVGGDGRGSGYVEGVATRPAHGRRKGRSDLFRKNEKTKAGFFFIIIINYTNTKCKLKA